MNEQSTNTLNRGIAEQRYNSARVNLLLMLILTLVNIVLFFVGADIMLLFSASVPYYSVIIGTVSGFLPFLIVGIVIAVITLVAYFICWILSKKHYGAMTAALILFILDSIALIGISVLFGDFSNILDFAIHVYLIYSFIMGVKNAAILAKEPDTAYETVEISEFEELPDSENIEE